MLYGGEAKRLLQMQASFAEEDVGLLLSSSQVLSHRRVSMYSAPLAGIVRCTTVDLPLFYRDQVYHFFHITMLAFRELCPLSGLQM